MNQIRWLCTLIAAAAMAIAPVASQSAASGGLSALLGQDTKPKGEFLPVEKAFRVSAVAIGPGQLRISWVIAPGYYLYQKRLKVTATAPGVQLTQPSWPKGEPHTDEYFGTQTVYRGVLQATFGVTVARAAANSGPLALDIGYQGCADAGVCYPPQIQRLMVELPHQAP